MRLSPRDGSAFVVRPTVALSVAWIFAVSVFLIAALITAKFPREGQELHVVSAGFATAVGIGNGLFLVALVLDGVAAWRQPPGLRRGPLAGVLLCVVNVLLLQVCAILAYAPHTFAPGG